MSVTTPPKARPAAAAVAVVLALALVAIAVVAVRDLAAARGWTTGTPWTLSAVRSLDGLTTSVWVPVAGAGVALLGLLLVVLALKPAPRTHLRASPDSDLWLSSAAVAALARGVADRSPGVVSAETGRVGRRRITVDVLASGDADTVGGQVRSALDSSVQGLTRAAITVRTREVPR